MKASKLMLEETSLTKKNLFDLTKNLFMNCKCYYVYKDF